jgi:hypothetical protein
MTEVLPVRFGSAFATCPGCRVPAGGVQAAPKINCSITRRSLYYFVILAFAGITLPNPANILHVMLAYGNTD